MTKYMEKKEGTLFRFFSRCGLHDTNALVFSNVVMHDQNHRKLSPPSIILSAACFLTVLKKQAVSRVWGRKILGISSSL
jgi:hypothetical protein